MQKGEKYLRKATEMDPQDGEIRYNLAATLAAMGKIEDAIKEFEAAEEKGIEIARQVIDKLREGMKQNAERK
jgi:tetratricopeptide (TPR) repeat protein